jgi:hypothetical protein
MAGYGDDGVDLTELTLGPPGVNARKARRARKNGQPSLSASSSMYVRGVTRLLDPVEFLLQLQGVRVSDRPA